MRLLIASLTAPTYAGGLAAYARQLAEAVGQAGTHQVSYCCIFERHPDLPDAAPLAGSVHPLLNPILFANLAGTIFGRLASRPRLHGILERALHWLLPDGKLLAKLGRPEIIHFVGTGWDLLGLRLAQYARRIGAIFTVLPAVHPGSWGDGAIDLRLYGQADAVFCLSDFEAAHLVRLGLPVGRTVRCGLAPNCEPTGDAARLRERLKMGRRPAVLFIGRRDVGKGYPALLEAWPRVLALFPDAILMLAGPTTEALPAAADLLPADSVRDLAVPDEETKADALAACDVFCLPSAHESFGLVYVEAWSYQKPVICGTSPASRELVKDGQLGHWSDGSPFCIAEKVIDLLKNPGRRLQMGRAGDLMQRTSFCWQDMAEIHVQTWKRSRTELLSRAVVC